MQPSPPVNARSALLAPYRSVPDARQGLGNQPICINAAVDLCIMPRCSTVHTVEAVHVFLDPRTRRVPAITQKWNVYRAKYFNLRRYQAFIRKLPQLPVRISRRIGFNPTTGHNKHQCLEIWNHRLMPLPAVALYLSAESCSCLRAQGFELRAQTSELMDHGSEY